MGNALTIFETKAPAGTIIPKEFQKLPRLQPPNPVSPVNPDQLWMICDEWRAPAIDGKQVCIRAPVPMIGGGLFGFFTDGISVSALAWSIFHLQPFSMPELCGAIGHDAAYSAELAPRADCDQWLLDWEVMAGVNEARAEIIYRVVRTLGGFVWKKHTASSVAMARLVCQLVDEGQPVIWPPIPGAVVSN